MKIQLLSLFSLLLFTATTSIGQQTERTLVKAFSLKTAQSVLLDLDGAVEVKEWNQDQVRIQMTITLQNGSDVMLKSLVQAGRYNLESEEKAGELRIFVPGLAKHVKMRNGDLLENVSFLVYAPASVSLKLGDNTSSSAKQLSSF